MNVPYACEKAMADAIVKYGDLGKVIVRVWHGLGYIVGWKETPGKEAPLIQITHAAESVQDNQVTMQSTGAVLVQTKTDDDRDHGVCANLYEGTHKVMRDIFQGFIGGTEAQAAIYAEYAAAVESYTSSGVHVGGVSFAEPTPPDASDGYNSTGIGWAVHFSYA